MGKKWLVILGCIYVINLQAQQVVSMEGRRFEYPKKGWQGNVEFGANYSKVVYSIMQLNNKFNLMHTNDKRNLLMVNDVSFVTVNGVNLLNSAFQHFRYIMQGDSTVFPEAFVQTQYNKQLALNLRLLTGAGLRFRIYKDQKSFFYMGNVMMYEFEEYTDKHTQTDLRLSSYVSLDISEWDYLPFTFVGYFQPRLSDIGDYRVSVEASLVFKSTGKYTFRTQARYVYDAFPPPGINKVYSSLNNSLIYSF